LYTSTSLKHASKCKILNSFDKNLGRFCSYTTIDGVN
jgi:hypothetical protein